jgi:hypothetical protein
MSVETKYHVIFIRISPFSSVAKSVLYTVSFEDSSLAAMSTYGNCQSHHSGAAVAQLVARWAADLQVE